GTPRPRPDRRTPPARGRAGGAAGARPSHGAAPARGGTRRSRPDGSRAPDVRRPSARRPAAGRAARGRRRTSWEESLQLLFGIEPRAVEPRAHRAHRQIEDLGDLFVREALDVAQDDYDAS